MNPFPWWPCGLASDTRRALPVKIQLYLPKIRPYLPMKSRDGAPILTRGQCSNGVPPSSRAALKLARRAPARPRYCGALAP